MDQRRTVTDTHSVAAEAAGTLEDDGHATARMRHCYAHMGAAVEPGRHLPGRPEETLPEPDC